MKKNKNHTALFTIILAVVQVAFVLYFAINTTTEKYPLLQFITTTGALALEITVFFLITAAFIFRPLVEKYIVPYVYHIIIILSTFAIVGSLIYSEVFGFTPCYLCWIGRACIYPQLIFGYIALVQKKMYAKIALVATSLGGGIVSGYHHYIQMGGTKIVSCPVAGPDCADRLVFEYGHITFPLMGLITLATVLVLTLIDIAYTHEKKKK